jgi:hypothetical protein
MAEHITGRRPSGSECDQEVGECRLVHEEVAITQGLDCFDRGVNFACSVVEDYIVNHKFTPDQLLQIVAVDGFNVTLGNTFTVIVLSSDCGAVHALSTAWKLIVFATPIMEGAAVKQKLPDAGL